MSDHEEPRIEALSIDVIRLTRRVEELERTVAALSGEQPAPPISARELWAEPPRRVVAPAHETPMAAAAPARVPVAAPPASPPPPPAPPRPPFDWGRFADQLFAARTLAWAGGVATALGIVL